MQVTIKRKKFLRNRRDVLWFCGLKKSPSQQKHLKISSCTKICHVWTCVCLVILNETCVCHKSNWVAVGRLSSYPWMRPKGEFEEIHPSGPRFWPLARLPRAKQLVELHNAPPARPWTGWRCPCESMSGVVSFIQKVTGCRIIFTAC